MTRKKSEGFTLIELMVVIAIIGILSMVGVPQYVVYSKRAKFVEVINAATQLRKAVEICMLVESGSSSCDSGSKIGVDEAGLEDSEHIKDVQVSEQSPGTVGIEITASNALNEAQYVLKGTFIPTTSEVSWLLDPSSSCLMPSYRYCSDL